MKNAFVALLLGSSIFASDATRGNHIDATIRDSAPLFEDEAVCARVAEIGQRVVAASGNESGFDFRFYVLNHPDITTFSAPGGSVYITTGLLRRLQSEDEIAVMLGHEIAHINKHHMMKTEASERSKVFWTRVLIVGAQAAGTYAGIAAELQSAKALTNTVAMVPAGQTQAYTVVTRPMGLISAQTIPSMQQYALITQDQAGAQLASLTTNVVYWATERGGEVLLNLYYKGFKDEYEYDADKSAVEYARKAGFDSAAMARILERLGGDSSSNGISLLHSSNKGLVNRRDAAAGQGAASQQHRP